MRITDRGQVTIPRDARRLAGLAPGMEVDVIVEGDSVRIVKRDGSVARSGLSRGQRVVERLRGSAQVRMTTDEIMALTRGE